MRSNRRVAGLGKQIRNYRCRTAALPPVIIAPAVVNLLQVRGSLSGDRPIHIGGAYGQCGHCGGRVTGRAGQPQLDVLPTIDRACCTRVGRVSRACAVSTNAVFVRTAAINGNGRAVIHAGDLHDVGLHWGGYGHIGLISKVKSIRCVIWSGLSGDRPIHIGGAYGQRGHYGGRVTGRAGQPQLDVLTAIDRACCTRVGRVSRACAVSTNAVFVRTAAINGNGRAVIHAGDLHDVGFHLGG